MEGGRPMEGLGGEVGEVSGVQGGMMGIGVKGGVRVLHIATRHQPWRAVAPGPNHLHAVP